ncbi:SAM-dependent chlorinase/fluorinase [Compostibacter hankyongensis]|uniref:SAM-dependent chlorinase/fluorinase n=2 Tax=Compostibacter hankyongensis TaxID=1007089 RepID=A0ABP8FPB4_9BACT
MQDYLIGAIRGQLHQLCRDHEVIDISHNITPFNFPQTAYLCKSAYPHFPDNTFHLILVNLFDRRPDHFLLAWHDGHYFCCADNGLLTMILGGKPDMTIRLPFGQDQPRHLVGVVRLFGMAIDRLSRGEALNRLGEETDTLVERLSLQPLIHDDWIEGQIIHIDHFENVVINITRQQFEAQRRGRPFRILVMRDEYISQISDTYADVAEGNKLALFNTAGFLEIAVNKGNAAGLFGLQSFNQEQLKGGNYYQSQLFYQTVRIYFE